MIQSRKKSTHQARDGLKNEVTSINELTSINEDAIDTIRFWNGMNDQRGKR